jgi:hypothetical protein
VKPAPPYTVETIFSPLNFCFHEFFNVITKKMLSLRGFSAWIVVDGLPVPEYLTAVNTKQNQVSCWIPSEEGKTFSVHWSDAGGKVDTMGFISLDGVVVPGRFLLGSGTTYRSGVRTSKTTEAPFVFKKIQDSKDGLEASPSASSKSEAGMITLKIKRVTRTAPRPANSYQDLSKIPQARPSAGDLCTGFGAESKSYEQSPFTWDIKPADSSQSKEIATYVSFVFRYRTREFLQAQGIMETAQVLRTHSPKQPLRAPIRRIVSAPAGAAPPTPSPTPPLRTPKEESKPKPYIMDPYPLRRPTVDVRRTTSWRAVTTGPDGPSNFMYFGMPSPVSAVKRDGSDLNHTASQ